MGTLLILIPLAVVISAVLAFLWWYYPYLRKPWVPKMEQLYGPETPGDEPLHISVKNPSLVIYKARREMELYDGDSLVRTYHIALGLNPVEDKRKEGDGCTPEGEFYICTKNDRSRFHLFMGLSYPNKEDAERGLKSCLISDEENARILQAFAAKKRPPWNTRLGGEIGIHGEGNRVDWTHGGIALDNKDIEELFMLMELGSPVKILP
ncbi:L,D-transpeptidase family protein [bacterium]|nr:L,D-transpeptidase family protein [bacterium]